jgi:hypothetical protein
MLFEPSVINVVGVHTERLLGQWPIYGRRRVRPSVRVTSATAGASTIRMATICNLSRRLGIGTTGTPREETVASYPGVPNNLSVIANIVDQPADYLMLYASSADSASYRVDVYATD